jgi:dihydropteroate synthase
MLTLSIKRPRIMGIVNITPDSFSDGGKFLHADAAIEHAHALIEEGADILDIGGESTRPGAAPASLDEELTRVIPVIEALRQSHPHIPLSIDTQKIEVMRVAIQAGVAMVNDVNALRADGAIALCAAANVDVCLMHMQGEPRTMQHAPHYDDVVADVRNFLLARAHACEAAGIAKDKIAIDPGIGFGKTLEHNLALLRAIPTFVATGYEVLIGVSRKSMFKTLLAREVDDRLVPSVLAAVRAAEAGAGVLRVHDVRETRDALVLARALRMA